MKHERPEGDFGSLIPELQRWNNGDGIDVDSWIVCAGSIELAIGYTRWFWPTLVLHDDCVLLEGFSVENYEGFKAQADGDRTRVEAVMNHWHLIDLCLSEPTRAQIEFLGGVMQETWAAKLRRDFPGRNVVVSFATDGIEELVDYEITAYQERA